MKRNLKTVEELSSITPFSQNQCRWWIQKAGENGLDKHEAIVRIGRRVYVDLDAFEKWIDSQQPAARASA